MREWALALVGLGILFLPTGSFADSGPVIISEVMANPAEEDTDEFIEVVNTGAVAVDLTDWTFTDGDALDTIVPWTIAEHGALNDANWVSEKIVLEPGAIAVILDSEYASGLQGYDVPHGTIALTVKNTTLGNALTTTDALTLLDLSGVVSSTYGTPKSLPNWQDRDDDALDGIPFNPGDALSVERKDMAAGDVESNWVASVSSTPGLLYTPPIEPETPEDDPDEDNEENDTPHDDPNNPSPNENETPPVYQNSADLFLNEVFPNPDGPDTEKEFVEIINKGTVAVDLTGWKLEDATSSVFLDGEKIAGGALLALDRSKTHIALNNSGGETVTLRGPAGDVKETVNYDRAPEAQSYHKIGDVWSWTEDVSQGLPNVPFVNTPPEAVMIVSQTVVRVGETLEADASDSSDADDDALTYEWQMGGETFDGVVAEIFLDEAGMIDITLTVSDPFGDSDTAQETVEVIGYDLSRDILLSEILPDPEESDAVEWVEIYNGGKDDVDLYGWSVTDKTTTYRFESEQILKSRSYLLIEREESGIALNNTGEEIFVVDPEETIVNGVKVPKAIEGQSFARKMGTQNWSWTTTLTPGKENIITLEQEEEEETKEQEKATQKKTATEPVTSTPKTVSATTPTYQPVTIAQVQTLSKGEYVTVSGTVSAAPGERGVQKMFISDGESELQIYSHKKLFPDVRNGDSVKVSGRVSVASGENRVNISAASDIVVLARAPEVANTPLSIPEVEASANLLPDAPAVGRVAGVQSVGLPENPSPPATTPWLVLGVLFACLLVANWTFLRWQKKKWTQKPSTENTWTVACETDDQ